MVASDIYEGVRIDPDKLRWSPRYVNFDECVLLAECLINVIGSGKTFPEMFEEAQRIFELANGRSATGVELSYGPYQENENV